MALGLCGIWGNWGEGGKVMQAGDCMDDEGDHYMTSRRETKWRGEDTIIRLFPPSSNPHVDAICKIPAGCGFGGRNSLVTMGPNSCPPRKVDRRWVTGVLLQFPTTVKSPFLPNLFLEVILVLG